MKVEGYFEFSGMNVIEQLLRVRNQLGVPAPSGPSAPTVGVSLGAIPVPVHIENHHVAGYVVFLEFCHDVAIVVGGVGGVFAVPVSEHVCRRKRYFAGYLGEVCQCFPVVVAITEEV